MFGESVHDEPIGVRLQCLKSLFVASNLAEAAQVKVFGVEPHSKHAFEVFLVLCLVKHCLVDTHVEGANVHVHCG